VFKGIGVSPGIVIGSAFLVDRWKTKIKKTQIKKSEIKQETERFKRAVALSKEQLSLVKEKISREVKDKTYTYIIDVHLLILEDQALINKTVNLIKNERVNAEWALDQVLAHFASIFDGIDDEYLRERKIDIEHVGELIKKNLVGDMPRSIGEIKTDVVVIAHDLTPADTVHMQKGNVKGFATDLGGRTSHTSIMARSLEIPAVVALNNITSQVNNGDPIIVDGSEGVVIVKPTQKEFTRYLEKQRKFIYFEKELLKLRDLPAETQDGYRIELSANIEFPGEVRSILEHGAEGVGLYRTEFLYLNRPILPAEEEQYQTYKHLAEQLTPLMAIIRIMDFGGDKVDPHLNAEPETNPVLGLRAIRFALKREDLLRQQLRAILRASVYKNLRILLPLISGIGELRQVKQILDSVKENLRAQRIPFDEEIQIGVMIEVPSAAMTADLLAKECDFFSIGTNDLIQYYIAIDRGNQHVAYLYEPLHPAVLRTIKSVITAAHNEGIWVGMCGEMAGDPLCTMILLGLEIDELSMNAVSIPTVKRIVRSIRREEAAELTYQALTLPTAKEIELFVNREMARRFPDIFSIVRAKNV
jgi:phosphotransferase system enzyme I (PtsI)